MRFILKLRAIAFGGAVVVGLLAAGGAAAGDYGGNGYGYDCGDGGDGCGYGYGCGYRGKYDHVYRPAAYSAVNADPTVLAALAYGQSCAGGAGVLTTIYAPIAATSDAPMTARRPLQRVRDVPTVPYRTVRKRYYAWARY
ncbi:MAG: hypothetical protein HYS06_03100 [Methylocystis sp.]|nr:hypothetical protein [Methylocystis sp.]MBI3275442.1 hypothetical protein [Methylocystis sp.]